MHQRSSVLTFNSVFVLVLWLLSNRQFFHTTIPRWIYLGSGGFSADFAGWDL